MKDATKALLFSVAMMITSIIIGDLIISLLTIAASVVRLAYAYDLGRERSQNVRPYRFQFMR
jgi:hypothetical protein